MMNMFKTVLASTAALGLVLSSTAHAESIRAGSSLPKAGSIAKKAGKRSTAPAGAESKIILSGTSTFIAIMAAGLVGTGAYFVVKDDNDNVIGVDTAGS